MNLLLYTEAKMKLARQHGKPTGARLTGVWNDIDISLPDSVFEELGYPGALDQNPSEEEGDEALDEIFRTWAEPALIW